MHPARRPFALALSFFSIFAASVFHRSALHGFWYWRYQWSDFLMHALIGIGVAALALVYLKRSYALLVVLLLALFWEIFEFQTGTTFVSDNFLSDTLYDVFTAIAAAGATIYFLSPKQS